MIEQKASGNEIELACLRKDVEDWKKRAFDAELALEAALDPKPRTCFSCSGRGAITCPNCFGKGNVDV